MRNEILTIMSAGFAEKKHETGGFKWKHRLSHVQNSIENEDQRTKTAAGLGSQAVGLSKN